MAIRTGGPADPDEWIFEPADPEVGIFGEGVFHAPCEDEEGDPVEAEEMPSQAHSDERIVTVVRTWRCPSCGKGTATVDKYPRDHFDPPTH